ncbi:hypothetical protein ASPZODRAFT_53947, partial [Penicilliopsis zonata CBS 506.65]
LRPPLEAVTADNKGPILTVVGFSCFFITFLIVLAKLGSSVYTKAIFWNCDVPLWIALLLAFLQTLLIQFTVDHGLGQHRDKLSAYTFSRYSKLTYAAQLLLILALYLSKASTCLLVHHLTPKRQITRASSILLAVITVWMVFALLGTALQCSSPRWEYLPNRCAGEGAIAYPIIVFNIATDLALIIIPIVMLWTVQMTWQKRLQVISAFASRVLAVIVSLVELALLPKYLKSTDPTWTIVNVAICNELMMYVSIIASCMPSLYRVLRSLTTGLNDMHLSGDIELFTTTPGSSSRYNRSGSHNPNTKRSSLL